MERNSIKYGYLRREINGASLKGDKMNKERIQKLWKEILKVIGEDVNREGLKNTPKRIAKMYSEVFRGYDAKNKPKITTFKNGFDGIHCKGIVCEKGYFFSHCEHHGVPFFGEYYFGYIPDKKIIGLSKVARVVDFFSSKFKNSFFIDELPVINKNANTAMHNMIGPHDRPKFGMRILGITYLLSKLKYLVTHSGNCSEWAIFYRGNANNIHQYLKHPSTAVTGEWV